MFYRSWRSCRIALSLGLYGKMLLLHSPQGTCETRTDLEGGGGECKKPGKPNLETHDEMHTCIYNKAI